MTALRLERLTLTQFRGSTGTFSLQFDPAKHITLIFGENGTGKSTIADAFDFVCNNRLGSLLDRRGATPAKHVVAYGGAPAQMKVVLECDGKRWHATLQKQQGITTPARPPSALVLRRSDIARVIDAQPADRYRALQAYITVPNVERSEARLRDAYKELRKQAEHARSAHDQALLSLEKYWQAEGAASGHPVRWAREKAAEDLTRLASRLDTAKDLLESLDRAVDLHLQTEEAQYTVTQAEQAVAAASAAVRSAVSGLPARMEALLALLENAQDFMVAALDTEQPCPVCGRPETVSRILSHVQTELSRMTHLQEVVTRQQNCAQALDQARTVVAAVAAQFSRACRDLAERLPNAPKTLGSGVDAAPLIQDDLSPQSLARMGAVLQRLLANRPRLVAALEDAGRTIHQRNAIVSFLDAYDQSKTEIQATEVLTARLGDILSVVEGERKSYVGDLVDSIAQEVQFLYEHIHPQEPLGRATFSVKQHTAGSLELKAGFARSEEIAPGAYYSEAHLDTLGLCVYLALAKHASSGDCLLVLDDVLTSVDDPHLERILNLLQTQSPHFGHLLIMTHLRAHVAKMRDAFGHLAHTIELSNWDLASGMKSVHHPMGI